MQRFGRSQSATERKRSAAPTGGSLFGKFACMMGDTEMQVRLFLKADYDYKPDTETVSSD
jgi:hypothetical protein